MDKKSRSEEHVSKSKSGGKVPAETSQSNRDVSSTAKSDKNEEEEVSPAVTPHKTVEDEASTSKMSDQTVQVDEETIERSHKIMEEREPSDEEPDKKGTEQQLKMTQSGTVYFGIDDVVNAAGYGKFQKFLTFLAGIGWVADAFEVIILSIIGDMLACHWTMKRWQNALMTSSVFLGMAIGAPIFGNFADRFGRRTSLAISMLLLFIFGGASAASPTYTWIIVLRALMGFALGGIAQGVTLCCEYYPANIRGRAGFYLSYYWTVGTIGVIALAWIVMAHMNNWRVFVFIAAVPALIVFLSMKWYPESARYYLVSDQPEKALKVLERMMRMNGKKMFEGKLTEVNAGEEKGRIQDLLKPKMRRATLLFWYIWLAVSMTYYGIALITPIIVKDGSLLRASQIQNQTGRSFVDDFMVTMNCTEFTNENFRDMLWTSAAEFPGVLVFTFLVECCSRKVFLGTSCFLTAFLMLFLMLDIKPVIAMFIVLFIIRGMIAAIFQLLFIMTTEAFPTTLRASAMGTGSGCARIGGLLVPYLAQVSIIARPIESMFVLSGIAAMAGVAAFLLPLETKGMFMHEVVADA